MSGQPMHIYSIRLRILTPSDGAEYLSPEQRGFATCQLHSRHWRISYENRVNEVRGEGVVGEYPLLEEGGYRRYSGQSARHIQLSPQVSVLFLYIIIDSQLVLHTKII